MAILQYLINGISIGSVYAIIALGYTMVYGIAKMLNFAHGDIIMVGAYISYCVGIYACISIRQKAFCGIVGSVNRRISYSFAIIQMGYSL